MDNKSIIWIKPIPLPIVPKQPCLRPDCIKKELQYSQSIQQNKQSIKTTQK